MRILQVAPLIAPIDERRQIGGAQVLVAELSRALARAGHDVTLAGADGSRVEGVRVLELGIDAARLTPAPLGVHAGVRGDEEAERSAFGRVRTWLDAHRDEIDVVHAHAYDAPAFDLLTGVRPPVVHTLHLPPNDATVVAAARSATAAALVAVSDANARAWRSHGVRVRTVIHNGVDVSAIPMGTSHGDHLLYAGRISPEKGVHLALEVARRTGRGIVLVGGVYDAPYHERQVAPRVRAIDELPTAAVREAVYLGPRPRREVHRLMGAAAVTLMPVQWDEPFGLVAVESLAAGTPVVGSRRGGLVEILDATIGGLVEPHDIDGFVEAVRRVVGTDPRRCRGHAMRFDVSKMVARYLALYGEVGRAG